MTVVTSRSFDLLIEPGGIEGVLGQLAAFALNIALQRYARDDFASPPWNTHISAAYAKRKGKAGMGTIGDLIATGALVEEVVSGAPSRIEVQGMTAVTKIELPYACTHQFGDMRRNIPQRKYIRLEEHRDEIIEDIGAEFDRLIEGGE